MFGLVKKNKDIEQLLKILEMDAANNYKDAVQEDTVLRYDIMMRYQICR